jgi:hypothetical protein
MLAGRPGRTLAGRSGFGFIAVMLASVNIFGGFLVTAAHARACSRRRAEADEHADHPRGPRLPGRRASCFILALRGLSHPETSPPRQPLRHGRHGASPSLDHAGSTPGMSGPASA